MVHFSGLSSVLNPSVCGKLQPIACSSGSARGMVGKSGGNNSAIIKKFKVPAGCGEVPFFNPSLPMPLFHRTSGLIFLSAFVVGPVRGQAPKGEGDRITKAGAVTNADCPNFLWVVSEDNDPFLGCYGDPPACTPTLDKLAKEGVLYERCFAEPVCAKQYRLHIATDKISRWFDVCRSCGHRTHSGPTGNRRSNGRVVALPVGMACGAVRCSSLSGVRRECPEGAFLGG